MEKIRLQTLKNIERIPPEDRIRDLFLEIAAVQRKFKPTVRSRREFEPDDTIEFDNKFEEKMIGIQKKVEEAYMKNTLALVDDELEMWTDEYNQLLKDYAKLREDNPKDQVCGSFVL